MKRLFSAKLIAALSVAAAVLTGCTTGKASEIGKGYTFAHIERTQSKLKYNSMNISHGNKLTSGKGGFHL